VNHKQNQMQRAGSAALLLPTTILAALLGVPGVVAATDTCEDTARGGDWAYPSCEVACVANAGLSVVIETNDATYVDATFDCGGETAGCTLEAPACTGSSPHPTSSAGDGDCSGSAYSTFYTVAYLTCTVGGGADTAAVMEAVHRLTSRIPQCEDSQQLASLGIVSLLHVMFAPGAQPLVLLAWNVNDDCVPDIECPAPASVCPSGETGSAASTSAPAQDSSRTAIPSADVLLATREPACNPGDDGLEIAFQLVEPAFCP
jgi:hypothetical protein